MGNCWSCMKEAKCGRSGEQEMNFVSPSSERPMELLTVGVVDAGLQINLMESSVPSTSMAQTSTAAAASYEKAPASTSMAQASTAAAASSEAAPASTSLAQPSTEAAPASTSMAQPSTAAAASSQAAPASTSMAQPSTAAAASSESQKPSPTFDEVKRSFEALKDETDNVDELISLLRQVLEKKSKKQEKSDKDKASTSSSFEATSTTKWGELVKCAAKFLESCSGHVEKTEKESGFSRKVVGDILDQVGHLHWAVGVLSIVAFVLENYERMSDNMEKCQLLLKKMVDLAVNVKQILGLITKEEDKKWRNAITFIIEGSIMCISQMASIKLYRFLKNSVNNETLNCLMKEIEHIYQDLNLAATAEVLDTTKAMKGELSVISDTTKAMKEQQPVVLPVPKPGYPKHAVGIEKQERKVINLLNLNSQDESPQAVVLYGVGGIGKTTLATAVVARLNLENYNYARVEMDEHSTKNDLARMQEQILMDAFPEYNSGTKIVLRDCREGQHCLEKAFHCEANKPVFIFIDNVYQKNHMEDLLPEDLESLPKRSRMLLTTRNLTVTDVCDERRLRRISHPMDILPEEQAIKILCDDPAKREVIKDNDVNRILKSCSGIPLVLKIVGAYLRKMEYKVEKCTEILKSLEKGTIKDEERLIGSVYSQLEDFAKEAFLDICCFFNKWNRRHVEYIVGAEAVGSLIDAAFVHASVRTDREMYRDGIFMVEEGEEWLTVHDVVRAIGRSMSKDTRIMDLEGWLKTTIDERKMAGIKGVWLEDGQHELKQSQLNLMKDSLRILALGDGMSTNGEILKNFKELRYLQIGSRNEDSSKRDGPSLCVNLQSLDRLAMYYGPIFS